jgi:streptomycin 6-kinase
MPLPIDIPPAVTQKALAYGFSRWLDDLPRLVEDLERRWSIEVGATFGDATEAFVAAALFDDGTEAVLKVLIPLDGDDARHEITVLRLAGGEGCARLLREDRANGALLLERLGPSLYELSLPIGERQEILCSLAEKIWRPANDSDLPSGADKGRWLAGFIPRTWEDLDRPCSERAVEHALRCASNRVKAHDHELAVLVHGDVHQWNALRSGSGYKLVDPDGLFAEPEYDLGILMREDPVELLEGEPFARARALAKRCGVDETAVWEWGVTERVSTGLLLTQIGVQPVGRDMLTAADQIAERYS